MPPTNGASSKRFELPKLDFKFGSLTDGTDIPPPLPSPVQEVPTPPQTPRASETKDSEPATAVKENANDKTTNGHGPAVPHSPATTNGTRGFSDDTPLSPAVSSRQGSIRRLFSRTLLNQAYAEGESQSNGAVPHNRPMSRSQGSIIDEKKAKRTSGWFKRLRSHDSSPPQKRASVVYEHPNTSQTQPQSRPQSRPQVQGPPPPMIPELSALEAKVDVTDGGSLGSDLFKNIK